jgi:hypothetical protein
MAVAASIVPFAYPHQTMVCSSFSPRECHDEVVQVLVAFCFGECSVFSVVKGHVHALHELTQ